MTLLPPVRKALLSLHVGASVGWLGAVAAFFLLSLLAAYGSDPATVRSAYVAMDPVGWWAVFPLNLLAVLTGFALALATPWGLLKHYWVATKLALTTLGTGLLLMHLTLVQQAATMAAAGTPLADGALHHIGGELVWDAGLGLLLLAVLTVLSVFKPWGLTRRALRRQYGRLDMQQQAASSMPVSLKLFYAAVILTLVTFMAHHHMPDHMHHHG